MKYDDAEELLDYSCEEMNEMRCIAEQVEWLYLNLDSITAKYCLVFKNPFWVDDRNHLVLSLHCKNITIMVLQSSNWQTLGDKVGNGWEIQFSSHLLGVTGISSFAWPSDVKGILG